MLYKADFHIHSCLSPCGSLEMSPRDIVQQARLKGLNLIAISDHNSAKNAPALSDVCSLYDDISCLFGIEVTSVEEVHCLTLFDECEAAEEFGEYIYNSLDGIPNNPDRFGDQVYVDAEDTVLGELDIYLGSASAYSVEELLDEVHQRRGLFIPAHVDRASFSMSSQLGFVPLNEYDAVEYSRHYMARIQKGEAVEQILNADSYPIITNSDSHYLEGIGNTVIEMELISPSIEHIAHAFTSRKFSAKSFV